MLLPSVTYAPVAHPSYASMHEIRIGAARIHYDFHRMIFYSEIPPAYFGGRGEEDAVARGFSSGSF